VASTKVKRDPDLPVTHWWIIEPVAQAIAVACDLAPPDVELAFTGLHGAVDGEGFDSREAVARFIRHVNRNWHTTGLPHIPESRVTPHMFRRTMAMLTSDFPGSEIALGMQLKHVAVRALANRCTQGYAEKTPAWARYFDQAINAARFDRLRELYQAHRGGEPIGYGPAAERLAATFDAVAHAADQLRATGRARQGDARVEHDLLRRTRVSLRLGRLNHCALDEANPVGAKCLEDAVVPDGHRGPLIDRCQPGRCANSIIAPEHLVHHKAYEARLVHLLTDRTLPAGRRAALEAQLADVREVIKKGAVTTNANEPLTGGLPGGVAANREGPARGDAAAPGRHTGTHRRPADQGQPLERDRSQPSHHEPGTDDPGRMGRQTCRHQRPHLRRSPPRRAARQPAQKAPDGH
jgi:hypothetical protein